MDCYCGRPLHYTDKKIEAQITRLVEELGENVKVTVEGRSWMVQRHYIALHGIKGNELPTLGFKEITSHG